jgi:hypothetical protein
MPWIPVAKPLQVQNRDRPGELYEVYAINANDLKTVLIFVNGQFVPASLEKYQVMERL